MFDRPRPGYGRVHTPLLITIVFLPFLQLLPTNVSRTTTCPSRPSATAQVPGEKPVPRVLASREDGERRYAAAAAAAAFPPYHFPTARHETPGRTTRVGLNPTYSRATDGYSFKLFGPSSRRHGVFIVRRRCIVDTIGRQVKRVRPTKILIKMTFGFFFFCYPRTLTYTKV